MCVCCDTPPCVRDSVSSSTKDVWSREWTLRGCWVRVGDSSGARPHPRGPSSTTPFVGKDTLYSRPSTPTRTIIRRERWMCTMKSKSSSTVVWTHSRTQNEGSEWSNRISWEVHLYMSRWGNTHSRSILSCPTGPVWHRSKGGSLPRGTSRLEEERANLRPR